MQSSALKRPTISKYQQPSNQKCIHQITVAIEITRTEFLRCNTDNQILPEQGSLRPLATQRNNSNTKDLTNSSEKNYKTRLDRK